MLPEIKFVQARHYTRNTGPGRYIDLLVIHTMENQEKPEGAENVANWFAGPSAPQASAHYCIDSNSIVQCVKDHDIAWAAPRANHNGLHFEHAGTAAQTHRQWDDVYSVKELKLSAELTAELAVYYGIPFKKLTPAQVRAGSLGYCGHIDVTHAFPGTGTHTDPGLNFPWGRYMRYAKTFANGRVPVDFVRGEL